MTRVPLLLAALSLSCAAQRISVYSPFTRIGPAGEVVKADRGTLAPRHILSPGVPRNAFSSLRIVVELDKPEAYTLDIGQNPENAVGATLYRENFVETAAGWIPDSLTKVGIPYKGFVTDFRLPGQTAVTFWLDMWVEAGAPVDRVKVEPQLYVESVQDWVTYPMEVRIQEPVVSNAAATPRLPALPPPTARADALAVTMVHGLLCSVRPAASADPPGQITGQQLLRRNIAQQLSLAKPGPELTAAFVKASGVTDLKAWCAKPTPPAAGPEWYLRFRDAIYRSAGATE
jgi:hypothetical protein